jgi:hypothetical protein
MKKSILFIAISLISCVAFAQGTIKGLKVVTPLMPSGQFNSVANVVVNVKTLFYTAGSMGLEIETTSMLPDSTQVSVNAPLSTIKIDSIYFNLNPTFEIIKAHYDAQGLTTEFIY